MSYAVKEIFYSVQGEGAHTGRAAVFCRFTGCNLWSGQEKDRPTAICQFCDTDFTGTDGLHGGHYGSDQELVAVIKQVWAPKKTSGTRPFVICTGGEPTLQLNEGLIAALHNAGFEVGIETNGTRPVPAGLDWICVSPKAGTEFEQLSGDELKLVFPKEGAEPENYEHLDFQHFFIQPMESPHLLQNIQLALAFCLDNPRWRLSLQTQKIFGDPSNEPKLQGIIADAPLEDADLLAEQCS